MKKILATVLAGALCFSMLGSLASWVDGQRNPYVGVHIGSRGKYIVSVGKTSKTTQTRFQNESISAGELLWVTSDEAVLIVDENGKFTGVSPGTCKLIAMDKEGLYTDSVDVTVQ